MKNYPIEMVKKSKTLESISSQISDIAINVKLFGAKGDGVTDDTLAIKNAIATGKNVYAPPGNYLVSDQIILLEGQTFFGAGILTVFTFNFVDLNRDYFRINKPNTFLRDIKITCNQTGDTSNSSAIALRLGAVNCLVENILVENVPSNAYVAEQVIDCNLNFIISKNARRHGVYLIASDNITVNNFKVYKNKLEPVVMRGKSSGVISGYKIINGLIDGVHSETVNWNAITLAQHPTQGNGDRYDYRDIHIENVVVKNTFNAIGYGTFFYYNGENLTRSKFLNNTMYGSGQTIAFDFRNAKYCEIKGNVSYDSYSSGFYLSNCQSCKLSDNRAFNSNTSGNPNAAGVLIGGNSVDITIDSQIVVDDRETHLCNYAVSVLDTSNGIKIENLSATGMGTRNINFNDSKLNVFGRLSHLIFSANNLTNGQSGVPAIASGGTGNFVMPMNGYVRGISVNINDLPTIGQTTFQVRKNESTVFGTLVVDTTSVNKEAYFQPESYSFSRGDRISIVYYVANGWDKSNCDASILVSLGSN